MAERGTWIFRMLKDARTDTRRVEDELEPEAYGEGDGGQVKRRGQEGAALGHDTGEGRGGSDSLPPARSAPART